METIKGKNTLVTKDMSKGKILTTGYLSGLGKHLYENLGGYGLDRETSLQEREKIKKEGVDVIIHCAFNPRKDINSDSLYEYLKDNIFLTKDLVSIPHKKFIFISSLDVYSKNQNIHSEEEIINLDSISDIYGITKLMSEAIVKNECKNYLILRCSGLLGKYSRKNSLIRIIEDEKCDLTLSGKSEFNYILHSDVLDFIKLSIKENLQGIYNVVSSQNITLSEIADGLGKKVNFGAYIYKTGRIDNRKIISVFPTFKKTSKEIINQIVKKRILKCQRKKS